VTTVDSRPPFPVARTPGCPFDPAPELYEWQASGKPVRIRLWNGNEAWLVTRYEDQRALLRDPRLSSNAQHPAFPHSLPSSKVLKQSGRMIVALDDPEHATLRRMMSRDFVIKAVEAKRERVRQILDTLIDDFLAGPKPADLYTQLALPLPSLVICDLLGVPPADQEHFQKKSDRMHSADLDEQAAAATMAELKDYLGSLTRARQQDPGDDLITRLVQRIPSGELTFDDVVTTGIMVLVAGHETTANMIALGSLALLQNQQQLEELRNNDDPAFVGNSVEELLRYLHITHSGRTRVTLDDVEVGGELIPAGSGVILAGNIGDRDPSAFEGDPNVLDLHRTSRHHIAFGFGVHQCLGQPLARMELQVVYGTLYRRIPTLALAVPLDELRFKVDRFVYGVHSLPVTW
jgi:cytochrome P450